MRKCFIVMLIVLSIFALVACKDEPDHEHTWDEGKITTPATCTTEGVKTYTCTGCGETKTEAIAALGHTFTSEWTYDETNHWHIATCEHTDEVADKAEHTWDAGIDNGNGKIVYKCTVCEKTKAEYKTYAIGATGPAGGLIFYDCDADNESGNADGLTSSECGWRYLETTAADPESPHICFGYYRESDEASNKVVGTSQGIGTGKENTEKLVAAMGDEVYSASSGSGKTDNYAAKFCNNYSAGGKDDWFLPSREEVELMYSNLYLADLGGFSWTYCSSSEWNEHQIYCKVFKTGSSSDISRANTGIVRPARAF